MPKGIRQPFSCKHCRRYVGSINAGPTGRRLCRRCYRKPQIRTQYQPLPKGPKPLGTLCLICSIGSGRKGGVCIRCRRKGGIIIKGGAYRD